MTSSADTEITLGTGKLLFLFFFLVAVCSLFFGLGYSLGRRSDGISVASAAASPQSSTSTNKPVSGEPEGRNVTSDSKAAEQKDSKTETAAATEGQVSASQVVTPAASNTSSATLPGTAAYFVQVAAVTKQDDAEALVEALKKKQYPAFVANASTGDKFFRVQLGPFGDIKDAEALRSRLINDGYSPILKK
ncbi:MAG TPA: SPOR domain-containing protein [Candidatus Sulfotelmatobacter sp.]